MPSAPRDDDDDDRPRRVKKPIKAKAIDEDDDRPPPRKAKPRVADEDDEDDAPPPRRRRRDEDDTAEEKPTRTTKSSGSVRKATVAADDDEDDAPVPKKKKKKKKPKELPGQAFIKYAIWGGIAFGVVMVGLFLYLLVGWLYVPAAATIDGVDWYKAPETLGRYDMLFPGGRPSHDLIRLRNPETNVSVRAELWQRKFRGRMYEACYISGDNVTAANINGAANNMRNSQPPNDWGKSWQSKIVLNDGARCIVMRVYGPSQIDENDPMVQTFFNNFKLPE